MTLRNRIAGIAMSAALLAAITPCATRAQQSGVTSPSGAAAGRTNNGPQIDPNFPANFNAWTVDGIPIFWPLGDNAFAPSVHFKGGPFYPGIPTSDAEYLGFDEDKGSLIRNPANGKVYFWKFKTLSLTVAADSFKAIPLDELASLKNASQSVQYYLAQNGIGPKPAPAPPPPPRQNPDKSAGLFGNNPQKALQGVVPAAGAPFEIAGKSASVQGGVLTFTLADGSKSKPYAVVRPGFMANVSQAGGVTGSWIATGNGGKNLMFDVRADNSVTGKEITPQVAQMLTQKAPKPQ